MTLAPLKALWSAAFDRIGHYDRQLSSRADERPWFIPMYHRILRDDEQDPFDFGLGVRERHFDRHLAYFRERFHVCTLEEGLAIHQHGDWPDRPLLSITFDDGYLDNIELALPLLERHGCKATFFICTGPIVENRPFWWDLALASADRRDGDHWRSLLASLGVEGERDAAFELREVLSHLWTRPYHEIEALIDLDRAMRDGLDRHCPARMQRQDIKQLAERGMEVAAHTHNHPNLTKEPETVVRDEIVRSKTLIEDWTERRITGFATPHGFVDPRIKACCVEQGLTYIASTDRGANRRLVPDHLARFGVADAAVPTLKRSLVGSLAAERVGPR